MKERDERINSVWVSQSFTVSALLVWASLSWLSSVHSHTLTKSFPELPVRCPCRAHWAQFTVCSRSALLATTRICKKGLHTDCFLKKKKRKKMFRNLQSWCSLKCLITEWCVYLTKFTIKVIQSKARLHYWMCHQWVLAEYFKIWTWTKIFKIHFYTRQLKVAQSEPHNLQLHQSLITWEWDSTISHLSAVSYCFFNQEENLSHWLQI